MKFKIKPPAIVTFILGAAISSNAQTAAYPLKASADKHYLVDQNNTPYPILGRTAWFIASLTPAQYHHFIENTVAKGHNAIEMYVIQHDPRGNRFPHGGNGELPFLKTLDGSAWAGSITYKNGKNEAPDLTTPNEKYWSYIDTLFSYCESKNIVVFMFPGYLGHEGGIEGWMQELFLNGTEKTEAYGRWIANRYKNQKNLVWMLLGDMGNLPIQQKKIEEALIKGLKSISNQQSALYSAEANSGQNSREDIDFGKGMTLNGTYSWLGFISGLGRKAYASQPVLPAFLLEEPYDEEGPDGNNVNRFSIQPVRRFQWWGWLSTIGGYISGNGYVWTFNSPDWQNHLDTKGAKQMSLLNTFIKSVSWWELLPSGLDGMKTLITSGEGLPDSSDYVAAAANSAGTLLVAYLPPAHSGSIEVDMTVLQNHIQAYWLDPANGNTINIDHSSFSNAGKHLFTPPGTNSDGDKDWVLVMKSKIDK